MALSFPREPGGGFWLDVFPYVALPAFYSQAGVNTKTVAVGLFVDVARRL